MELGPIQKQWVADLRAYPERQATNQLGSCVNGMIKACCLGQLLITANTMKNPKYKLEGQLFEDSGHTTFLEDSFEDFGLHSKGGSFMKTEKSFSSLVNMNDSGLDWIAIADFIENNSEKIFTKSV